MYYLDKIKAGTKHKKKGNIMAEQAALKIGDSAFCINDKNSFGRLQTGKIYPVSAAFDGTPTVNINGAYHCLDRFVKDINAEIEIGQTYQMDFGWNFKVTGFKKNKVGNGAWNDEVLAKGLKWNNRYGKGTAHSAFSKLSDLLRPAILPVDETKQGKV